MEKAELKRLKEEKAYRLENEKYRYYEPVGKVEEFIKILGSGEKFVVLLSAANGVGKTRAGVNILAHLMFPCGNPYFKDLPLFKDFPYLKRGRIISDPTTVTSTIIREIKDQFPRGRQKFRVSKYTTNKEGKRYEYMWRTNTGWEFDIMTYDQDPKEFESATLGWAWFDEPPSEEIFKATVSRMRRGGVIFITETPLKGSAWLYDKFIANPNLEKEGLAFVHAEIEDACKEHGVRGFLEHKHIMQMVAQYDDDDKHARIFGQFQHLTGLVFKQFSKSIHVIEPFFTDPEDYVVTTMLDPHPRNPDALMLVATDRQGRKFIIDEAYKNFKRESLLATIRNKEDGLRIVKRLGDPSMFNTDQHTGDSLGAYLMRNGITFEPGSKKRSEAVKRTGSALSYQMVANEFIKAPELYVFSNCTRTIFEFLHWQWDDWSSKAAQKKSAKEVPMDKDDHMMENIGRALLANVQFEEMPPEVPDHVLNSAEYNPAAQLDPFA